MCGVHAHRFTASFLLQASALACMPGGLRERVDQVLAALDDLTGHLLVGTARKLCRRDVGSCLKLLAKLAGHTMQTCVRNMITRLH